MQLKLQQYKILILWLGYKKFYKTMLVSALPYTHVLLSLIQLFVNFSSHIQGRTYRIFPSGFGVFYLSVESILWQMVEFHLFYDCIIFVDSEFWLCEQYWCKQNGAHTSDMLCSYILGMYPVKRFLDHKTRTFLVFKKHPHSFLQQLHSSHSH